MSATTQEPHSSPSKLAQELRDSEREDFRGALRHLLARPIAREVDDPSAFASIVRHRKRLADWFRLTVGWTLFVERHRGFARLRKIPARIDASHGLRLDTKPAFDRRRYTLLALALAALSDSPTQVSLVRLVEFIEELSVDEEGIEPYDATQRRERRALVDALQWLTRVGVLTERDGDTTAYARGNEGDALFDVDERLLGQLLAAPKPPSLAGSPEELLDEAILYSYSDTDEGEKLRARHHVTRRLLDEPVLYVDELSERQADWLLRSLARVTTSLERDVGFCVERRREGIAAIDRAAEVSDTLFPHGGSTIKHAALLLAELLSAWVREGRGVVFPEPELITAVEALIDDYGERCFSREFRTRADAPMLTAQVLELLSAFNLVQREDEGWRPRPAIARFAPEAPGALGSRPQTHT